jgi:hypothetical protein
VRIELSPVRAGILMWVPYFHNVGNGKIRLYLYINSHHMLSLQTENSAYVKSLGSKCAQTKHLDELEKSLKILYI